MNRTFQIVLLGLLVLAFANRSHAELVTVVGDISSTLMIDSVVDSNGNPVSPPDLPGVEIQSEPFTFFENLSSGGAYSVASAVADAGVNPEALGSGDSVSITNTIGFGLNSPGETDPYAVSEVRLNLINNTLGDVTVNFSVDYQFHFNLSSWTVPTTFAFTYGDLQIAYGDEPLLLDLAHEMIDPVGGDFMLNESHDFAVTLASGQDTTLLMTSFLGGEASATAIPEPSTSLFLSGVCLALFGMRAMRRQANRPARNSC